MTEKASAAKAAPAGRCILGPAWRRHALPLAFLTPSIALVVLVTFYPVLHAVMTSLHRTHYMQVTHFTGLSNYIDFVFSPSGRNNILRTLLYVLGSLVVSMPLGGGIALLLNGDIRFRGFFRTVLIIPWLLSQVVTALLVGWLLHAQAGPVNHLLRQWLNVSLDFLGQPLTAMPTLILANVWRSFPYPMLLILAALQQVPDELHEAATIDGAGALRRLFTITLPLIRQTLLITAVMLTLHYFNMVTLPLVLTGGGPVATTDLLGIRVYREAFEFYNLGFASAVAVYLFAFNVLFSLLYIKILKSEPVY